MLFFLHFLLGIFCFNESYSQSRFQSSYGGHNYDVGVSLSIVNNSDIVFFATSNSFDGNNNLLLSKINKNGNILWTRTYGGHLNETAVHFEKTSDNGFILLGNTSSFGSGNEDIFIIKVDSLGNINWSKTYGGPQGDFSGCVKEVTAGGYIVVGRTQSMGEGDDDGYVIRVDQYGNILWAKSYGTNSNERFYYVDNTNDQGFIISGIQKNFSNYFDQLVVKIDNLGNILFSKNFGDAGGTGNDAADCIKQTVDGGYILSGQYRSFGSGGEDLGLTKIDSSGTLQWAKVYGNQGDDRAFDFSIDQLGNIILVGYSNSFGIGGFDGFMIKVDQLGNPFWYKTYGYNSDDYFAEIEINQDGYVIVGHSISFGMGDEDIFIVKTDFEGSNNIDCTNINVSVKSINPIETDIVQIVNNGGNALDVSPINKQEVIEKNDFLAVNFSEIDSSYFLGSYEVPLIAVPSGGIFTVDGVSSSHFIPSVLGQHIISYSYEVVPGCIYNYEKEISVISDCKYLVGDAISECESVQETICIPLIANSNIGDGVIGLNYCLNYDSEIMTPTGSYFLGNLKTNGNVSDVSVVITSAEINKINVSINCNSSSPFLNTFSGIGELLCIEFRLAASSYKNKEYIHQICELVESHQSFQIPLCSSSSNLIFIGHTNIDATLTYKEDAVKMFDIIDDLKCYLLVDIFDKTNQDSSIYIDDINSFAIDNKIGGKFSFSVSSANTIPSHHLMKYRNGFDAFQMEKIITNKVNDPLQVEPSPYAMIAADVDLSDKVRANDISLLQEVIVKKREGFPQQLPAELRKDYLDWRFIDQTTVNREDDFKKASQYPYYSSKGYCRDNVPDIPFYLDNQGSCDENYTETYSAILLGDLVNGGIGVNLGSFNTKVSEVSLDIDDVHDLGNNIYRVFFSHTLAPQDKFVSFDFSMDYDDGLISIVDTKMTLEDDQIIAQWLSNDYNREELLFTSYSTTGYPLKGNLLYFDLQKLSGSPTIEDLGQLHVFVNGAEVPASIRLRSKTSTGIDISKDVNEFVTLYPNPTAGGLTVSLPLVYSKVHIEIQNTIGQSVYSYDQKQAKPDIDLDLSTLPSGLYQCLINIEGKATVVKKVVVK